jgi:translation initiation factor IF-1
MKIESIEFLSNIDDILDENVDVAVKLEDGHTYVVVVATQKNLCKLMEGQKVIFYLQTTQ